MLSINNIETPSLYLGGSEISSAYYGDIQVYPSGYPVGTIFNFDYTGTVQEITLPKGRYQLECWGAQGGTSYTGNATGSKGGYSKGILALNKETTLYAFVGGKGSNGTGQTSMINGGWNGGGASVGKSIYSEATSYPACGGGSTDFATVTSSMSYSSNRTNRSSESLLSRCIVAGGGAGGSIAYYNKSTTSYNYTDVSSYTIDCDRSTAEAHVEKHIKGYRYFLERSSSQFSTPLQAGDKFRFHLEYINNDLSGFPSVSYDEVTLESTVDGYGRWNRYQMDNNDTYYYDTVFESVQTVGGSSGKMDHISILTYIMVYNERQSPTSLYVPNSYLSYRVSLQKVEEIVNNVSNTYISSGNQQGGGISGKGQYPGTQSSAGSGGAFGLGANQSSTNYRYVPGASGGGWYGGGCNRSNSSTSYVNYSGGGSGFVNIAANASYRPSGYTGLELESGETIDGSKSFPAPGGGTETGHSGNGYARITVL